MLLKIPANAPAGSNNNIIIIESKLCVKSAVKRIRYSAFRDILLALLAVLNKMRKSIGVNNMPPNIPRLAIEVSNMDGVIPDGISRIPILYSDDVRYR